MSFTLPAKTPISIKKGTTGTEVFAVQRGLNSLGSKLVEDGSFGALTETAVSDYQLRHHLVADGICGPATQVSLAQTLIPLADPENSLPKGLARGIVEGESGNYIAAVNWSVPGGVDCGYTQRRVYTPSTQDDIKRAFDSKYQLRLLRNRLVDLTATFKTRPAVHSLERATRLAVLSHNYPAASERLSKTPDAELSSYWRTPQDWVTNIGAKFDDGQPVRTPLEWCRYYSLGDSLHNHKGKMVKYVESWS